MTTNKNFLKNVEIKTHIVIEQPYESEEEQLKAYILLLGPGSSGSYDEKTKIGIIRTFKPIIDKLVEAGYKDLEFCNGGDDDHMVIDHDTKTFGFFEDYPPSEEDIGRAESLQELYNKH